jgi:hypothetical protein
MTRPINPSRRTFLAQSAAALALARTRLTHAAGLPVCPIHAAVSHEWDLAATLPHRSLPQPSPLGTTLAAGDLAHRTTQNFTRLQDDIYRAPLVFRQTNWQSWPGDFEGRALLAVTLLSQSTGQEPGYFPAMVAAYPAQLNPQGYFGPLLDLHAINEQQLSGHGWFLRGLCEYYEWKRDPATLAQIRIIVRNLALPLIGKYAVYPIDPELRATAAAPQNPGAIDGHLSGQHGDWAVSSDTGCAFIFLDGLAHAWVVLKAANAPEAPALKSLINEAIARFLLIDLVAIKAQTHASLTALRALLRIYNETADPALLAAAETRYHLYRTTAMTEHYANTNWFGRPDSWTEPCAIIDSFMVATQLWQHTANPAYLEDAHLIWFNGVGRGLRANGGFGTDTCVGTKSAFLRVRSYEAYFCCTMRGGEGHARAAQYLYFTRPAHAGQPAEITVPFYSNSETHLNLGTEKAPAHLSLHQRTMYPYGGSVSIVVGGQGSPSARAEASRPAIVLRLFAPSWTTNHRLRHNARPVPTTREGSFVTARLSLKQGDMLDLKFDQTAAPRDPIATTAAPGSYVFMNGPLVLGHTPPADPGAAPLTLRSPDPAEVHIPRNPATRSDASVLNDPIGSIRYITPQGDIVLAPINDINTTPTPHTDPNPRQILFRTA